MTKKILTLLALGLLSAVASARAEDKSSDGFVSLFDGKSLSGWKASENKDSWSVADGAIVAYGPRSHLFYVGDDKPFVNFHFKADVMTTPGSNAGIYFATKFQENGWPSVGYEAQVNNSHTDPKRTGSLYNVVNVLEAPAKDNEWYTEEVIVQGKHIIIKANGKTLVDYTEKAEDIQGDRKLSPGTFALQAHDPKSKVLFKNIMVKRLP